MAKKEHIEMPSRDVLNEKEFNAVTDRDYQQTQVGDALSFEETLEEIRIRLDIQIGRSKARIKRKPKAKN